MSDPNLPDGDFLDPIYRALCNLTERHFREIYSDTEWLADRLMSHGLLNGYAYDVIDGLRDLEALQRIDRALIELSRACSDVAITGAAALRVQHALMFGPHLENPNRDKEASFAYVEAHGQPNAIAFSKIAYETAVFREAITKVIRGIKSDPRTKRSLKLINVEAIGLVDGCRFIWKMATGKDAPSKDLNPASKFATFLADAMETCEIPGDPRSAFLAWAREQKKRP